MRKYDLNLNIKVVLHAEDDMDRDDQLVELEGALTTVESVECVDIEKVEVNDVK